MVAVTPGNKVKSFTVFIFFFYSCKKLTHFFLNRRSLSESQLDYTTLAENLAVRFGVNLIFEWRRAICFS